MSNWKKVMEIFDKNSSTPVDRALFNLLMAYEKECEPLFNSDYQYFHKAFRQIDVIDHRGGGRIDAAIYNLLRVSDDFWKAVSVVMMKDQCDDAQ